MFMYLRCELDKLCALEGLKDTV